MLQSYDFLALLVFCLTLLAIVAMTDPKARDNVAKEAIALLSRLLDKLPKKRWE
jgi:hypothetical protein